MTLVHFPLSLYQVEDLLDERGVDISFDMVRAWWNWFGALFSGEIRTKLAVSHRSWSQWRWPLDEVFVGINGEILRPF